MAGQDDFRIVMGFSSVLSDFLGLLARYECLPGQSGNPRIYGPTIAGVL